MQGFKSPSDSEKLRWTQHAKRKLMYYRLTPSRVLRVVRAPQRTEEGVAPGTVAGMQSSGTKRRPSEIWVMWRAESKKSEVRMAKLDSDTSTFAVHASPLARPRLIIITAWRYPGISPVRGAPPIPEGVLSELQNEGLLD